MPITTVKTMQRIKTMFQVICLETNEALKDDQGNVISYESGGNAAFWANQLTIDTGKKHQVRRVANNEDWRKREMDKFTNGEYDIPFWLVSYAETLLQYGYDGHDKFVHVSKLDPSKIAYTQDADKGERNIQTQIKVGSYIQQSTKEMPMTIVREIALAHAKHYAPNEVQFAISADDIVDVYANGPNSCMGGQDTSGRVASGKKDASFFNYINDVSCHPASVYGDSDLSLAYIKDDDRITARCLVWADKKIFGRSYGDSERIESALRNLGYQFGYFNGAKIKHIICENNREIVLPYLDHIQHVKVLNSEWLEIDRNGDILGDSTNGIANLNQESCENCEDTCRETYEVYTGRRYSQSWCEGCRDNNAFYCTGTDLYVDNDEETTIDGESYASWYANDNAHYCEYSETWTFGETVTVHRMTPNGRILSQECNIDIIDDHAFMCRISNEQYETEFMVKDVWTDEPRAICHYPNDIPSWYIGEIVYKDPAQCQMTVIATYQGYALVA